MYVPDFIINPSYLSQIPVTSLWLKRHELQSELSEILTKAELATQYHNAINFQD